MQIIAVTSDPNQVIKTTLNIDGRNLTLQLKLNYNEMAKYWVMQIYDPNKQQILLNSIPLLCGIYPAGNLLSQFSYLRIGSAFVINLGNSELENPDDKTLGTDFILVWGDTL